MTSRIALFSIITLCLTVSCTSKHHNEFDFDKAVMQEIFPLLLDSMYTEITFSMTPPRIIEVVDSITGKKELKPVEKGLIDKKIVRNELSLCDTNSNYIIIFLSDSIHALSREDLEAFRSKYSLSKETTSNSHLQKSYLLLLKELTARPCFKLKLSSQYQPTSNNSMILVRQLKELSFSRIIFDADKTHGMLTCEYVCGLLCGSGFRVYIKKAKSKWEIEHIEHIWVS